MMGPSITPSRMNMKGFGEILKGDNRGTTVGGQRRWFFYFHWLFFSRSDADLAFFSLHFISANVL